MLAEPFDIILRIVPGDTYHGMIVVLLESEMVPGSGGIIHPGLTGVPREMGPGTAACSRTFGVRHKLSRKVCARAAGATDAQKSSGKIDFI